VKSPFLIGSTIYLRPLEREDAGLLVPWINDPEVTRTLRIYRPMNLQAEEEFVARSAQSEHELVLGIAIQATDKLIGATGLHQIDFKNRHAGFGISIGEKAEWGKGYGTEAARVIVGHAFDTLNLNRVWLHVFEYNLRGIRAYERVGFRREGLLRQDRFHEGRYWDTIVMAMIRQEYQGQQATDAQTR
jgi:RimJ/RimL family protein N-acetyltransferase